MSPSLLSLVLAVVLASVIETVNTHHPLVAADNEPIEIIGIAPPASPLP